VAMSILMALPSLADGRTVVLEVRAAALANLNWTRTHPASGTVHGDTGTVTQAGLALARRSVCLDCR